MLGGGRIAETKLSRCASHIIGGPERIGVRFSCSKSAGSPRQPHSGIAYLQRQCYEESNPKPSGLCTRRKNFAPRDILTLRLIVSTQQGGNPPEYNEKSWRLVCMKEITCWQQKQYPGAPPNSMATRRLSVDNSIHGMMSSQLPYDNSRRRFLRKYMFLSSLNRFTMLVHGTREMNDSPKHRTPQMDGAPPGANQIHQPADIRHSRQSSYSRGALPILRRTGATEPGTIYQP